MLSYLNGVFIAVFIFYVPALAIAALLAWRHGFGRSSGWFYLILFSLIRLVEACFNFATINDPTNISLYIGFDVLQHIGLSPLELVCLGLLSRVISSINKNKATIIHPRQMKLIQIIVTVGLILGIVGGTQSSGSNTSQISSGTLNKVGLGLFLAAYVLIVLTTIILSFSISHAEPGEKRILLALALALPFILVRLINGILSVFGNDSDFNPLIGNVTILLCTSVLMEFAAVIIFEAVGLTLQKAVPIVPATGSGYEATSDTYVMEEGMNGSKGPSVGHQIVDTLGRRTIVGRLITGQRREGRGGRRMRG